MPRIQMLECISGPTGTYKVGDIWDHPDAEDAKRIVAAGYAILLPDSPPEPETGESKMVQKRSKR